MKKSRLKCAKKDQRINKIASSCDILYKGGLQVVMALENIFSLSETVPNKRIPKTHVYVVPNSLRLIKCVMLLLHSK